MKIAIVGTGIAGNVAAHYLNKSHDITVYEANDYIGGHTHTHGIKIGSKTHNVDTGFIVFNEKTYPNFIKLLSDLNVEYQKSDMSFSVQCHQTGLEYNGTTLNSLFAQRRNLFRPSFYRMIRDIIRFNENSLELLSEPENNISLGRYLEANNYSSQFCDHYIFPMGAAIWSTSHEKMFDFPARFFVQFFNNHGMLSVNDRPQWYVIKNGSSMYVDRLIEDHKDKIRLSSPVDLIRREDNKVYIYSNGEVDHFDYVFIASHSNQALTMLEQPTRQEKEVLSAIPFTKNEAILHTDSSVLPKRKLAWAAWNYHLQKEQSNQVALTYNMNILQSLKSEHTFCVSLNYSDHIKESKIIKRMQYTHPLFTREGVAAQAKHSEINGTQRTFYCGAYWRFGFHEDGVVSSLRALNDFEKVVSDEKQNILWPRSA
ncbi:NAD(P)/FAD-dependent oxidoreductase [Aliikangiella coralliicola]|uniref:FAD-dependent oxidoreductase n=1 Tax=Aliikangiella coralliicola TaxID=2592383 RepID=A0A545U649_9GAMM|nr:FAD-dependent oxidoreductase [Aliikangiella coralliicola]TQV84936.1 FAD-dependent oxidoreductase [Aliikangiella coralliicola]